MMAAKRVAGSRLPTRYGDFAMFVYEDRDGKEHVALTVGPVVPVGDGGPTDGDVAEGEPVLVRMHSECLTGDLFGSRRCDCGEQLDDSMKLLQRQGRGVLLYLRQEGRGIGLTSKLHAYTLQDRGMDTVEANLALGLPEDARDYRVAAEMLRDLGVFRACVLTNNPAKIEGLKSRGIEVVERLPLPVSPNPSNFDYLQTKRRKMGHILPPFRPDGGPGNGAKSRLDAGETPETAGRVEGDAGGALGRPAVTISYAQTLDGRLATRTGSSQWISCPDALLFTHQLRADHDAILVGSGTVLRDDPRLTVRRVPGRDPLRVVVDSALRTPPDAAVLANGAARGTVLAVTGRAPRGRLDRARELGAAVLELPADGEGRVKLGALLSGLETMGVGSVMVEGGATLITSLLRERLVDRLVACVAPKILGCGIEAVGELGISNLDDAVRLVDVAFTPCDVDMILDGSVEYPETTNGR